MAKYAIGLACNLGASTSILVNKMQQLVNDSQKLATTDVQIDAFSAGDIHDQELPYQVIMLAPQIAHRLSEIEDKVRDKHIPVVLINPGDFGTMNAASILKQAIRIIRENER